MKFFLNMLILYFFIGCGAQSDLLRDDISTVPQSSAYEAFKDGVYIYNTLENERLGFDTLNVDSSCTTKECILYENRYQLFDGNISLINKQPIILTSTGFHEKFSYEQCSFEFVQSNQYTISCPDGRDENHTIEKISLENQKIKNYDESTIKSSMLKDINAKFSSNSYKYQISSTLLYYELDLNDTCLSENSLATDENITSYDTITCTIDKNKVILKDLNESNSTLEDGTSWIHTKLYEEYSVILIEDKNLFIGFYDGAIRIGKIVKGTTKTYLNKSAFDTVYSQLVSKYIDKSQVYTDLENELYLLQYYGLNQGYKKLSSNDESSVDISKSTFFSTNPTSNWILTDIGLKRESSNCDIDIYFDKFFYSCEDNQKGYFEKTKENPLDETLIFHYLKENNISFNLDNNDTFFSIDTKELKYKKVNTNNAFIFNIENSLLVGDSPSKNNASNLNSNLFITNLEKNAYLKLETNGTVGVYETNSSSDINISNSNFVSNTTLKNIIVSDKNLTKIEINDDIKELFSTNLDIYLIEFELSTTRVITGEKNPQNSTKSFLNFDAFKDIESNIKE